MADGGREAPRGARNPAVAASARLHRARYRRQSGQTLIEGPHLLEEALAAGVAIERVFALESDHRTFDLGVDAVPVDEAAMARLAGTETPRGPVAVISPPEPRLDRDRSLLVAHGVAEPGNLGSLIRTAAAFGWGFAWTPGSADPWSPKSMRAGAGGQFRTGVAQVAGVVDLDAWTCIATVVAGGEDPADVGAGHWAVLVGTEAGGLSPEVVAGCERKVTIPMPGGTESLNAGVAAAIIVYELTRQSGGLALGAF